MPHYSINDANTYSSQAIDWQMFGLNLVLTNDNEFADNPDLQDLLGKLGAEDLRFPGGSVTESHFTEANFATGDWEADSYIAPDGSTIDVMTLSQFMEVAGHVQSGVQLVIPTRVAFAESAGQALANGTYGLRTELADGYMARVQEYVDFALSLADQNGVKVTRLEIGNEFWGGAEMNAVEYGKLAANLTSFLGEAYPGVEIIAQVVSSANAYSPLEDNPVYLEPIDGGDFVVHLSEDYSGTPPSEWISATIAAVGNAVTQTRLIADQFLANPDSLQHLTGIVDHVYFKDGFDGIDGERDFALDSIYTHFTERLGAHDIGHFITEWSARNPHSTHDEDNNGNANGLQYGHTIVEAFFELSSHGVDGASFWPTTFGNPNTLRRVLVDSREGDLTFGGVTFQWLSETTVGLLPLFDYEVENEIDVHGFGNTTAPVFFVGERSGEDHLQENAEAVTLDFAEYSIANEYFVLETRLTSDDGSFDDVSANPQEIEADGRVLSGHTITLDTYAWDLVKLEFQEITHDDNVIEGGSQNDFMRGRGGHDSLIGGAGDDSILGDQGNDTVLGGEGDDHITGGYGNDSLYGSLGDDEIWADFGSDTLFGGNGQDTLGGNEADDIIFAGNGDDQAWGGAGNDHVLGGDGNDTLGGREGNDTLEGGNGDDEIWSNFGDDFASGGIGDDLIGGSGGDDTLMGGSGDDTLLGSYGEDHLWAGSGHDVLTGGNRSDVFHFRVQEDTNQITDFELNDLIHIHALETGYNNLEIDQLGNDAVISFQGTEIILEDFAVANIFEDLFVFG